MRFGGGVIARAARGLFALCFSSALLVLAGTQLQVYAVGTDVHAVVDDGSIHPSLTLTSPVSPATIDTMPLLLSGTVSDISQIQVYVDGVFSVTIPLDQGATSFSYSLVFSSGTHEVKLVGISPFITVSPTVTSTVTYTPPVMPTPETVTPQTDSNGTNQGSGGAIISRDGDANAATTYIDSTHTANLPEWLYNGLLAVDIATPGDSDKEIVAMAQRVAVVSGALFLIVFARPAVYGLTLLRFKFFGLKACRVGGHSFHPPSLHFRVIGILLMAAVFSFS